MRAMRLHAIGRPLRLDDVPVPVAGPGQLALRVEACGICRTDLHLLDGEVGVPVLPRTLGHQIVGRTEDGRRFGVPWLGWTDGTCEWCRSGRENLCPRARFTGRDVDGGFAEYAVADERFCFPIPDELPAVHAAPLLCAGLIGHRAHRMTGDPRRLGIYGFGSAGHILCQVATWEGREVYAFTRPGDVEAQRFARRTGAVWAGDAGEPPPEPLDAAVVFAPSGALVPAALRAVAPGGVVVCGGIHMSDIPSFPYADLWEERVVRSVANLTRRDALEFLELAPRVPVVTTVTEYRLEEAERALDDLRAGRFEGSAVVVP
ncbi:MAG TPA: zinc-dependent alcohol dehydrogenase family protein [Capillimicrobium sp.]|nr:zinc-dependent alcohol dehydrogenase family protein [Capillimicrobium sp.]